MSTKDEYTIVIGEVGSEIGHESRVRCASAEGAVRSARRRAAEYDGDGWWIVRDSRGEEIGRGGRFTL